MTNKEIVQRMYQAYIEGNREAIEPLIASNFKFTSPLDNAIDRTTYFQRCWPNSQWIKDFRFVHLVENGDQVFVTYEGVTNEGEGFRNTEIITLKDHRAIEVEVYFGWNVPHKAKPGEFLNS
ncbi:MAG TPA: ketosteroid isomerase [Bdellovibrionales bacterium]|nr:ketosteroid isomerase [Pseudobdellovibrionaceae bacterium]HAG90442.1 ketosteroid isomerase [Bdellovibrionales bacterium]|tara:strand:- start:5260 stop:5625 length:366 start_codon:yes stop_codon:yes gene_type:complete